MRCVFSKTNVRFEMEIAHLDNLDCIYLVKFKRLKGDTEAYKDISEKVLSGMHL